MTRLIVVAVAAAAIAGASSTAAHATQSYTFTTSQSEFTAGVRNQGWWSADPAVLNSDSNANYVATKGPTASEQNFFTFDLRDLPSSCAVGAATLRLTRFEGSGTGTLTYGLWDVSTPAATLNHNDGFSPAIAADLSSGTSFGSFAVDSDPSLPVGEVLSFSLNGAGVAAVAAARGGFFSIGGALSGREGFLFGFSGGSGVQELLVDCQALPTSKDECKSGGWRTYGVFKNQGDCVSFVATGGKNPPAG
jgi:hypothetical protein